MKQLSFLLLLLLGTSNVFAEADSTEVKNPWKCVGTASITMTQSSYSNWVAGGENSIAGVAAGSVNLLYVKKKLAWDSSFSFAYGTLYQKSDRRKTDDRVELFTKLGYEAAKHWRYTSLVQLRTQLDKGYKSYPIKDKGSYTSAFFSPAYLTSSLGMDYTPQKNLSIYMSPVTVRSVFVLNDTLSSKGAFGVHPGEKVKHEYGAFLKISYVRTMLEKILLKSRLELFSDLGSSKPQNLNLNFETQLDFKITKWVTTTLYVQMLYDENASNAKDQTPSLQIKEVMGLGLMYIF